VRTITTTTSPTTTSTAGGGEPAVVDPTDFAVRLSQDGTSGTFEGTAITSAPNTDPVIQPVSGSFSCVPAPFSVGGTHPLALLRTNCVTGDNFVSAGDSGNAALLAIDTSTRTADATTYETTWLEGIIGRDGISANFIGLATDTDGSSFEVTGSFSCLGG
jgi:hypothetical protein